MVNPKDEILSKDEDDDKSIQSSHVNGVNRSCTDCHTTRTPLWRGGPAGPKSLCNACGIRYRKKRRAIMGLHKVREDKTTEKKNSLNGVCKAKEGNAFKLRLMPLGREMGLKRKQRRKLGEEEQAAILLMALSSSSVYT